MPARARAGESYPLEIVLEDPALQIAGFMLTVSSSEAEVGAETGTRERAPADTAAPATSRTGALASVDATTEIQGTQARSTQAGALPRTPGILRWRLVWTAPAAPAGPVRFEVWANAGNDDLSPLGDRLHRRFWQIAVAD